MSKAYAHILYVNQKQDGIKLVRTLSPNGNHDKNRLFELIHKSNTGLCKQGSILALHYLNTENRDEFSLGLLATKHINFFRQLRVVAGNKTVGFRREAWAYHVYGIVQDHLSHEFHAFSPANSILEGADDDMFTVISHRNIHQVFEHISNKEDQNWGIHDATVLWGEQNNPLLMDYQNIKRSRFDFGGFNPNVFTTEEQNEINTLADIIGHLTDPADS